MLLYKFSHEPKWHYSPRQILWYTDGLEVPKSGHFIIWNSLYKIIARQKETNVIRKELNVLSGEVPLQY